MVPLLTKSYYDWVSVHSGSQLGWVDGFIHPFIGCLDSNLFSDYKSQALGLKEVPNHMECLLADGTNNQIFQKNK